MHSTSKYTTISIMVDREDGLPGRPTAGASVGQQFFSEEVLERAKTAKLYIEHLYKSQSQNFRERLDRWVLTDPWVCVYLDQY